MKVNIYINGKRVEEYSKEELEQLKKQLTIKAMRAAGFVPAEEAKDIKK